MRSAGIRSRAGTARVGGPQLDPAPIEQLVQAVLRGLRRELAVIVPFHQQLMRNEDFRKGNFTTKFLEGFKMEEKKHLNADFHDGHD